MKVIAAKGLLCPKEENPREYITDTEAVDVPDESTYYRRLVDDGSLELVTASPKKKEVAADGK